MRYYKIETKEYIKTANIIPEEMLSKKGLLPVIRENINLEEGVIPKEETGFYIEKDKVRDIRVKFYHVDTLDEVKVKRIKALKQYIQPKFPDLFKQINTLLGEYDKTKSNEIKKQVKDMRVYIQGFEDQILASTTIDDANAIDYIMEEDRMEEDRMEEDRMDDI